jgi:hypothetical protein
MNHWISSTSFRNRVFAKRQNVYGTNEGLDMIATELLTEQLEAVTRNIEAIEVLIAEYAFKNIDQRLRLREIQILYRTVAKSLDGAVTMFE